MIGKILLIQPEREAKIRKDFKKRQGKRSHLEFGASTIAAIYKDRWEIEILCKTLKQHLKVKTFIGTSENALRIQIWTALIALLLLEYLHHFSRFGWSMSNLATMLRLTISSLTGIYCDGCRIRLGNQRYRQRSSCLCQVSDSRLPG